MKRHVRGGRWSSMTAASHFGGRPGGNGASPAVASHLGCAPDWLEFPIARLGHSTAGGDAGMMPGRSLRRINAGVFDWRGAPSLARQHDRMIRPRHPSHGGALLAPRFRKESSRRPLLFPAEAAAQSRSP